LDVDVCSSPFFSSAIVGVGDADVFFCSSLGSGFFASLILKPGGGPFSFPCVDVSVA